MSTSILEETLKKLNIPTNYSDNERHIITNILPLDELKILGSGKFIQLVGESGTGRTSIALQIALAYCVQGLTVVFVDADGHLTERKLDMFSKYRNKNFIFIKESLFNELEQILDGLISTGEIDLIIIDSLPSLINSGYVNCKKGKKKTISIDNNNTNYDSRPLGLFINKYHSICSRTGMSMLLVNGYRNKISKLKGTVQKRYGLKTLDYSSSDIIEITEYTKNVTLKKFMDTFSKSSQGKPLLFKVVKNNTVSENTMYPFFFKYGKGVSNYYYGVFYLFLKNKVVQNGGYYAIPESKVSEKGIDRFANKIYELMPNLYKNNKREIIECISKKEE